MTSTRRAAMRRALRDLDTLDLTDRQKALVKALCSVPRDTTSPAAHMEPSSEPVMETLLQFVDDCGFTTDLDLELAPQPSRTQIRGETRSVGPVLDESELGAPDLPAN